MKALITGVAGFLGSTLAERLLTVDADIIGIDSFTEAYPRHLKERNVSTLRKNARFRLVEASLQDADLPLLLADRTHVFHFAAQAGVRGSWGRNFRTYLSQNVEATQALLEACIPVHLERFVYASSSSVYGADVPLPMREDSVPHPISPYGMTKLAAEQLCHLYHRCFAVPAVSLRFFTVYGPRQRPDMAFHVMLSAVLRRKEITVYGDGEQTRDFTFVSDAVNAAILAATLGSPGGTYNIGGGTRVSVNQVLEEVSRLVGQRPHVVSLPEQNGDMRDTLADTSRARLDLGFVPQIALAEGLAAEYSWLKNSRHWPPPDETLFSVG